MFEELTASLTRCVCSCGL